MAGSRRPPPRTPSPPSDGRNPSRARAKTSAAPKRTSAAKVPIARTSLVAKTGSTPPKAVGLAELLRRLASLEAKLGERDREREDDAETIGGLLAEVADRDRRLLAAETRAASLVSTLARADAIFEQIVAHYEGSGPSRTALDDLRALIAVTLAAVDATRSSVGENVRALEEARLAATTLRSPSAADRIEGNLARARRAQGETAPVDRGVAKVADRLRELDRRERELAVVRAGLFDDARALLGGVEGLRDALEKCAEPPRKKPSKLPAKRR
jgi:chromosome segregation ATPase